MGQRLDTLAATVRRQPRLADAYRAAFGAAPGADDEKVAVDVAKALAAWQATLVSPRTPFDDFRDALARGDTAAARAGRAARAGVPAGRHRVHRVLRDRPDGEGLDAREVYRAWPL
jgi:cytochrome c peroxidase